MDTTHPNRRRALAALMSPAALVGAGADAPPIYPSEADKEAIASDLILAGTAAARFDPIPEAVSDRLALHCTRLLREVLRRDKLGLR